MRRGRRSAAALRGHLRCSCGKLRAHLVVYRGRLARRRGNTENLSRAHGRAIHAVIRRQGALPGAPRANSRRGHSRSRSGAAGSGHPSRRGARTRVAPAGAPPPRRNAMPTPTTLRSWRALEAHRGEMEKMHMRALFESDPNRFEKFSLRIDDLLFDYSKNRITERTMELAFP